MTDDRINTWLILDVNCLAYRALYSTGDLSYEGAYTGVLYGIFRDIINLQDLFNTKQVVFCFDAGYDKRLEIFPDYKKSRRTKTHILSEDEQAARKGVRDQVRELRDNYLPKIGFQNLLWQQGFEADDIIPSVCYNMWKGDKIVIVTTDQDMYQLLYDKDICVWNPISKSLLNRRGFAKKYGIPPNKWAKVKAIGGCSSDDIPGVHGVGEKSAIKYLKGLLKKGTERYESIKNSSCLIERNTVLTTLPMAGTLKFELKEDDISEESWAKVLEDCGMRSLRKRVKGVKPRKK